MSSTSGEMSRQAGNPRRSNRRIETASDHVELTRCGKSRSLLYRGGGDAFSWTANHASPLPLLAASCPLPATSRLLVALPSRGPSAGGVAAHSTPSVAA